MKNILYILYRYYNNGPTKNVAYLKSISVFLLLVFINILTLSGFLDLNLPDLSGKSTIIKYLLFTLLYALPGYILVSNIVKKKQLEEKSLEVNYKKKYGWLLVIYWIISIIALIFSINYKHT